MIQVESVQHQTLGLAEHVRACTMNDQVVLLDLRRSKYFAVSLKQWETLIGARTSQSDGPPHASRTPSYVERLARPLMQQRILTRTCSMRVDSAQYPEVSLDVRDTMPFSAISRGRVWRFLAAATWAAAALRFCSLGTIVNHVAGRASRLDHTRAEHQSSLRDVVAAFDTLRPLLFTARDKCLYDSLALVRFLASEKLSAKWVIGVKTQPFAAHSWVQDGAVVLNDLHENVRRFKPILVV